MPDLNPHDPGPQLAGDRGEAHAIAAREPLAIGRAAERERDAGVRDRAVAAEQAEGSAEGR